MPRVEANMNTDFPKKCACGRVHTRAGWAKLPLVGHQDDGDEGLLELRNCFCRSTLAIHATEPELGACRRCGRCEELLTWRGLQVCVECEYALQLWADDTVAAIVGILRMRESGRAPSRERGAA
jgi:hypothetical protein